jgi:hypothetical protein
MVIENGLAQRSALTSPRRSGRHTKALTKYVYARLTSHGLDPYMKSGNNKWADLTTLLPQAYQSASGVVGLLLVQTGLRRVSGTRPCRQPTTQYRLLPMDELSAQHNDTRAPGTTYPSSLHPVRPPWHPFLCLCSLPFVCEGLKEGLQRREQGWC